MIRYVIVGHGAAAETAARRIVRANPVLLHFPQYGGFSGLLADE